jgi:predicted nucleic acid-binding protein
MVVTVDTNVLIKAFISPGLCADLLRIIIAEHDLILGDLVSSEMEKALPERQVQNIISFLESFEKSINMSEDPSIYLSDLNQLSLVLSACRLEMLFLYHNQQMATGLSNMKIRDRHYL